MARLQSEQRLAMKSPLFLWFAATAITSLSSPAHGSLKMTQVWPSAADVPVDAPLRIVFNEPPVPGSHGRIIVCRAADRAEIASVDLAVPEPTNDYGGRALRYQPVLVEGNTATIRLHTHSLKEGESYFVRVEPGAFKDAAAGEWTGIDADTIWRFQTKRAPAMSSERLIVAADGGGDFCTVQGAVDAVPADRLTPTAIIIRRGTYDGFVRVPVGKDHVHFLGEDRRGVVLTGTNNDQLNRGVSARALIGVEADDFLLENMTVRNLTPYKGTQAEALHIRGDRCVLRRADFYSFQDTLGLDGRTYAEDCGIEGSVDFIWGTGSVFFERCELHAVHGGVCIQARTAPGRVGFIFDHCRITTTPGDSPVCLARIDSNRFPGSQVVFLHCQMDRGIQPAGWQVTGDRAGEVRFAEIGSTDLLGKPLNVSQRRAASKPPGPQEVAILGAPVTALDTYGRWNPQAADAAPVKVFDVRLSGAKGDGTSQDAAAIQKALDTAGLAGGGIVRVPTGTFLIRPLFLRSHVSLHLDEGAILRATDDPADFGMADNTPPGKTVGLINGTHITDVAITGRGTIDGAGARWWQAFRAAKQANQLEPRRPRLVCFNGCRGVTVQGVTLKDSPMFHLVPADCEDVTIRGITIIAPADSPNTDGIDPAASRRVTISDCRIDTGDDNIAIKSGHADPAHPGAACADIVVSNCTFLHGHGMSIGSETLGGVSGVLVQNCTFENTRNGLRIKSPRGRGGLVQNVRFTDVQMTNVDPAISITCYYPSVPAEDAPKPLAADTPVFRGIEITNLVATCPHDAGEIIGLPESPITNLSLDNVRITAKTGFDVRNVGSLRLTNVEIVPPVPAAGP